MMHQQRKWFVASSALCCVIAAAVVAAAVPQLFAFHDATGEVATFDAEGAINTNDAFFQSLGTNGRSCATCHRLDHALSFSSAVAQTLFAGTGGDDPLFADVDGANCSGVDRHDASAHSLLLSHGLIRISLPVPMPPSAQFTVSAVDDPYGCADDGPTAP